MHGGLFIQPIAMKFAYFLRLPTLSIMPGLEVICETVWFRLRTDLRHFPMYEAAMALTTLPCATALECYDERRAVVAWICTCVPSLVSITTQALTFNQRMTFNTSVLQLDNQCAAKDWGFLQKVSTTSEFWRLDHLGLRTFIKKYAHEFYDRFLC